MKKGKKVLLAFVAVAVTVGVQWYTTRTVAPKESAWEDVVAEAMRGGYQLISNEALQELYTKKPRSLFLVDTRQEWEYRTGHIRGASNFPFEPTWLSRWRKKGALETFLGPDRNRLIVFY
jgi:hypothetical protein